jgi:outer membrane protein OmpA-like peptidoglycan-associated protein
MRWVIAGSVIFLASVVASGSSAQNYKGPFVPHRGMQITTFFENEFGKDADSQLNVVAVSSDWVRTTYRSTRGIFVSRDILIGDRQSASAYVLGYAPRMPTVIPGTTSIGISGATLDQLRSTGSAPITLVYSDRLDRIDCTMQSTGVDIKEPVLVDDRIFEIPTVQATVVCGAGRRRGAGTFIFANDVNNPVMIESNLKFSWEARPRRERVTRVAAGMGMHADMEQSLDTLGTYDVYGLHFDFDRASLRSDAAQLVREIAVMLHANANWVIQIAGHTDSIGDDRYNFRLSADRASAVRQALINQGIRPQRLKAIGMGETQPKADNGSFAGRAINRRVEFRRLDR